MDVLVCHENNAAQSGKERNTDMFSVYLGKNQTELTRGNIKTILLDVLVH